MATIEPDMVLPRSQATVTLPTWEPKEGQKVVDLKWNEVEVRPFISTKKHVKSFGKLPINDFAYGKSEESGK